MNRVLALVEGHTERTFLQRVVAPELIVKGVDLRATVLGKPGHKGGIRSYETVKRDIVRALKQDRLRYCTTMVDYYGLPSDWPTKLTASHSTLSKAEFIEGALLNDICSQMGEGFAGDRFIPYVQMHEYEALLFSEPTGLAEALHRPLLAAGFQAVLDECGEPEAIDDSPETAPSKRILRQFPQYDKVLQGTTAAERIGLARMREKCPHFAAWLSRLESVGAR